MVEQSVLAVDWDSIEIVEEREEEGRIELCSEESVYALLGLRQEDEREEEMNRAGASILVDDYIPEETSMVYDKDNPIMSLGTIYPSMEEFRLAVRQYAINKEFELAIEATNKSKFRGYCKGGDCNGGDCPWSIVGFKKANSVIVTVLNSKLTCS
jgi:hypothetical protein